MDFIEDECKRFKEVAMNYAGKIYDNDEKRLYFEKVVDSFLSVNKTMVHNVYRDMEYIANKCKYCGYMLAKPDNGTYEEKADHYLKDRSKWTLAAWGTIVMLVLFIGGMLFTQFKTMATDIRYIKEEIVPLVKFNTNRITAIENALMKQWK